MMEQYWGCAGKMAFANKGDADRRINRQRKGGRLGGRAGKMHPYRCAVCHKWHVGCNDGKISRRV